MNDNGQREVHPDSLYQITPSFVCLFIWFVLISVHVRVRVRVGGIAANDDRIKPKIGIEIR